MKQVKFNTNWHIQVKLTEFGIETLMNYWMQAYPETPSKVVEIMKSYPKGEWIRFQLWEAFQIFGKVMRMSGDVPFETDVLLEVEE